ncbi:hypothetical protein [Bacillus sp. KH172YL63]|uniref:hypothetical protein n=1 Tax=Bacillus sp. KH172YL63 TaxID=2709784 RepID=UPI0013E4CCEF|nr:hypothetical protein [Bacillus sp. KH172YL63]BCB03499.1 hypothetical protein KH172YL63_16320 [Bacillus sp. KH172YL63]
MSYKENLENFLSVLTSSSFIKNAIYNDAQRIVFINYYESYEDYKRENENSPHSEHVYADYFKSGAKIEKILIEETARILRQFPFVNTVSVTLDFEGENYNVNVEREKLNSLIGFNIEETSNDDGSWQEKFQRIYGGGLRNDKRKMLLDHFRVFE